MENPFEFILSQPKFDFDAGELALDFANTADWHASAHPVEELNEYSDLLKWGVDGKLINEPTARHLAEYATQHPEKAKAVLEQAVTLREAIYRVFRSAARDEPIPHEDIAILNQYYQSAMQHQYMTVKAGEIGLEWEISPDSLDAVIWPVAHSAAQILTSDNLARVGQCQDDRGCGWLFIDTSKNHTRRWCSMESCGNRAKAQRHYGRSKKSAG